LRRTKLLTAAQQEALVENPLPPSGPDGVVSSSAPAQYIKVVDGRFYVEKATGLDKPRVELFFESDPGIVKDEFVEVSGIHAVNGKDIEVSGTFEVTSTHTPPWEGRQAWRVTPSNNITHAVTYIPAVLSPSNFTSTRTLVTKAEIKTLQANTTTATVTTVSTHKFKAGDVIMTDIDIEPWYGLDGLFKIANVTSNTITYEFPSALEEPIDLQNVAGGNYIWATAHQYVRNGATWIDTSTTPNTVWVWKDIRWIKSGSPSRDSTIPSAPTNLEITSVGDYRPGFSYADVTLTWTAPTTNEDASVLDDLAGYQIWHKESSLTDWVKQSGTPENTWLIKELKYATSYDFRVYTVDSGGNVSGSFVGGSHVTATLANEMLAPTPPVLTSRMGTVTVLWDGLDAIGQIPPSKVVLVESHYSITDGFTPDESTIFGTFSAVRNNYNVAANLEYDTDYYFKFVLVDSAGNKSTPSAQSTTRVLPIVGGDLSVGNVLNSWAFNGNLISAGALANGALNASTLFGPNVVVQEAIAANAIGANQLAANSVIAGKIGANAVTANTIAANSISANAIQSNAITADKISAGAIDGQTITGAIIQTGAAGARIQFSSASFSAFNTSNTRTFNIDASTGNVTLTGYLQVGGAASDINSGVTTISGGKITTGTIQAESLNANAITGFVITGGKISTSAGNPRVELSNVGVRVFNSSGTVVANLATTGAVSFTGPTFAGSITSSATITGGTIRTASSGERVQLNGSNDDLEFFNSAGTLVSSLSASTSGLAISSNVFMSVFANAGLAERLLGHDNVTGLIYRSTTGATPASDIRLKNNIQNINISIDLIKQLNPVSFTWKADPKSATHVGLIAQEVEASVKNIDETLLPAFIALNDTRTINSEPTLAIKYNSLTVVLINSVKFLLSEVEFLKNEIESIKTNLERKNDS
jgi:hypothetical protein